MMIGTAPVDRLAGIGAQHINGSRVGEGLQRPVDGGESDAAAALTELIVQFLGRLELVNLIEQR